MQFLKPISQGSSFSTLSRWFTKLLMSHSILEAQGVKVAFFNEYPKSQFWVFWPVLWFETLWPRNGFLLNVLGKFCTCICRMGRRYLMDQLLYPLMGFSLRYSEKVTGLSNIYLFSQFFLFPIFWSHTLHVHSLLAMDIFHVICAVPCYQLRKLILLNYLCLVIVNKSSKEKYHI